ncbi:MAG: Ig-like domain-containing protein [Candidatus Promineifilaceae bacterium]|nr:Ig-like domain-containing protein [Candidatus Promineifilaceae bacterium]
MKSSASIAISLTLLMFILVLAAAVFFLFQGRQELRGKLATSEENIKALRDEQAKLELSESGIQATLETVQNEHALSNAENVELESQLIESTQANATLEAANNQQQTDLDNAQATVDVYEAQGPLVTIVKPQDGETFVEGQMVEIIIVASDPAGIAKVNYTIGDEIIEHPVEAGNPVVTVREVWTPSSARSFELTASAINNKEKVSRSSAISFTVDPFEPTNTPQPTEEPTLEATSEATPES